MISFDEYAARCKIKREAVGNDTYSLLEKVWQDGIGIGKEDHPDPRYRALRATNKALRSLNRFYRDFALGVKNKMTGLERDLEDFENR